LGDQGKNLIGLFIIGPIQLRQNFNIGKKKLTNGFQIVDISQNAR